MSWRETLQRGFEGAQNQFGPVGALRRAFGGEQVDRLQRGILHEAGPGSVMAGPGLYAIGAGAVGALRDRGSEASQGFGTDFINNMGHSRGSLDTMRDNPVVSRAVERYHEMVEGGDTEAADTLRQTLETAYGVDPRGRSSMQFVRNVDEWGRDKLGLEDQTRAEEATSAALTALLPAPKGGLIGKLAARAPASVRPAMHTAGRTAELMLPGSAPYTPGNIGLNAGVTLGFGELLTMAADDEEGYVGPMLRAAEQEFDDIMSPLLEWEPPARDTDAVATANQTTGYDLWLGSDKKGDE